MKRSPLIRKSSWKKINGISQKRVLELREYSKLRNVYLCENPICLVCHKQNSTQVHHRRGRGIFLNDVRFFLAVCSHCHYRITNNPKWAMEKGYSIDRLSK